MRPWFALSVSFALAAACGCSMPFTDGKTESGNPYELTYDSDTTRYPAKAAKKSDDKSAATTESGKRVPNADGASPSGKRKPNDPNNPRGEFAGKNSPKTEAEEEYARMAEANHLYKEAQDAIRQRDYGIAENCLAQATQLHKEHPAYWSDLGRVRFWRGKSRYPDALAAYRRTLELLAGLEPSNREEKQRVSMSEASVYANLGDLYREWNKPGDALEAYGEALKRNPGLERLPVEMGHQYLNMGLYDDAVERFQQTVRRSAPDSDDPNLLKARLGLAIAFHMTDRNDKAYEQVALIERRNQRIAPDLRQSIVDALRRESAMNTPAETWRY